MTRHSVWQKVRIGMPILPIIFWLSSSFPASMSYDSFVSWDQVKSGTYADIHTPIFTLYLKTFSLNGFSVTLFAFLQSVFCASIIYLLIGELVTKNKNAQVTFTTILMALPQFGLMSITIWKDIPFTLFICSGLLLYYNNLKSYKLLGLVLIGIGASFRREGLLIFFFLLLLIFLIGVTKFYKVSWKSLGKVLSAIMICLTIAIFCNFGLPKILKSEADPTAKFSSVLPFFHDIAYAVAKDPNHVPESAKIDVYKVMGQDGVDASMNCGSIWAIAASPSFDWAKGDEIANDVMANWFRTLKSSAAGSLLRGHYCRTSAFIPFPISLGPSTGWVWTNLGIDNESDYSLEQELVFPKVTDLAIYLNTSLLTNFYLINWPGFIFSFILVNFFVRKKHKPVEIALVLVSSLRELILIVLAPSQEFRFAFLLYILGYLYLCKLLNDAFEKIRSRH